MIHKILDYEKGLATTFQGFIIFCAITLFFLFFLIFIIGFFIKIYYTKKKYGTKHFHLNKKRNYAHSEENLHILYFNQILGYKRYIPIDNSTYLLLHTHGIFLIKFYKYSGSIVGSAKESFLIYNETKKNIPNPFIELDIIHTKICNIYSISLKKILIIHDLCLFNVTDYENIMVLKEGAWTMQILKLLSKKPLYTEQQIEDLYKLYNVKECQ